MKAIKLIFITAILFLSNSNSFSTPLSGIYTIGAGGDYPTITSAVSDVTAEGVSGPVVFDILTGTYNEVITINPITGVSSANTVTFKSQTGNKSDVVINGAAQIFIISRSSFLRFRDFTLGTSASSGFTFGAFPLPDNIIIENIEFNGNNILSGIDKMTNLLIKDNTNIGNIDFNDINFSLSHDIQIKNNTVNGFINIWATYNIIIENNIIDKISLTFCGADVSKNKVRNGLYLNGCGYMTVSNNFISSINGNPALETNNDCIEIKFIYNTFYNNNAVSTPAIDLFYCREFTFLNNLIINNSGGNAFVALNTINNSLLNSDYNNFFNSGNFNLIKYNNSTYNSVADFYNATSFDEHSNSSNVAFISPADLHLTGSSIGDVQLAGIPTALVNDDIDGQPRNPLHPYKGADEAVDFPLPVELASFTSSVIGSNVKLNWTTSTENNNSGFDIERSKVNGEWSMVNFVAGNGNSNIPQSYSYDDRNLSPGKYKYRLKQIDFNGNFKYYELQSEVVIGVPDKFILNQNYPNPFNPVTKINYSLPNTQYTILKVYDISGKQVATLVSQLQNAGIYSIDFDGSKFASGQYFYKIESGEYSEVKRMILIK